MGMKEFIMQGTEEMTTFGSVWKRYEPVAELVRCKDCKFWYKDECSHLCKITGDLRPANWFCADGERAE